MFLAGPDLESQPVQWRKTLQREGLMGTAPDLKARSSSPRSVAQVLGHRDIRMTSRYSHLAPGHLREAMATLERRA